MMAQPSEMLRMPGVSNPLRDSFMRWQCRVRQMMMRDDRGRPGDGITPALTLKGEDAPMGHVITLMSKLPQYSKTPEMRHLVRKTNDPALRREMSRGLREARSIDEHAVERLEQALAAG